MAGRNEIEVRTTLRDDLTAGLKKSEAGLQSFKASVTSMLSLVGVAAVAAAATFVTSTANMAEQLGKLSAATGVSRQNLQKLGEAMRQQGGAPEDINQGLRILNNALATGDKTLKAYGITATNAFDALQQVGFRLSGLSDPMDRARLAQAAFGRSSQDLVDTVTKFTTDAQFRAGLGIVTLSGSEFATLDEFDKRADQITAGWKRITESIGVAGAGLAVGTVNATKGGATAIANLFKRLPPAMQSGISLMFPSYMLSSGGGRGTSGAFYGPPEPPPNMGGTGGGINRPYVYNPGYAPLPGLRGQNPAGWASGYRSLLSRSVSGLVPEGMNTYDIGKNESWERNRRAVAGFASSVEASFSNMFMRVFAVQTRSNNVIVNLFADLANSIIGAITDRIGQSIGNAIIGFASSFIPGLGGAKAVAGSTVVVNTLESKSLVDAMLTPTGSLRSANVRIAQIAAVR